MARSGMIVKWELSQQHSVVVLAEDRDLLNYGWRPPSFIRCPAINIDDERLLIMRSLETIRASMPELLVKPQTIAYIPTQQLPRQQLHQQAPQHAPQQALQNEGVTVVDAPLPLRQILQQRGWAAEARFTGIAPAGVLQEVNAAQQGGSTFYSEPLDLQCESHQHGKWSHKGGRIFVAYLDGDQRLVCLKGWSSEATPRVMMLVLGHYTSEDVRQLHRYTPALRSLEAAMHLKRGGSTDKNDPGGILAAQHLWQYKAQAAALLQRRVLLLEQHEEAVLHRQECLKKQLGRAQQHEDILQQQQVQSQLNKSHDTLLDVRSRIKNVHRLDHLVYMA